MSAEFPTTVPTGISSKLPQDDGKKVVSGELSLEERSLLQAEIELLEGKTAFAWGRENETAKTQSLIDVRDAMSRNPRTISQGLSCEETLLSTLHLIETVWHLGRKEKKNEISSFHDRAQTEDEDLALDIESRVMESETTLKKIMDGTDEEAKMSVLDMMSGLLNSSLELHRSYGESFLMEYLPVLAKNFLDTLRISREDEAVHVWQEMFLRVENPKYLRQIGGVFKAVWEKRREKEEQEKKVQEEKGEEIGTGRDWSDLYNNFWRKIFSVHHNAFERNKDFALKTAIDMTSLDGSKMMRQWMRVGDDQQEEITGPSHQYAYTQNLQVLYELKQVSSDAPSVLFDQFGITHFGRYTREMLVKQYEEREIQKPYGIILFPIADHNGAFFHSVMLLDQIQRDLETHGYSVRIVEADSKESVARRLITLDRIYGQGETGHKIDFAFIGGHGSKNTVSFGEGEHAREQFTTAEIEGSGIGRGVKQFFTPEAKTMLFSCSTGAEGGIAEEMFERLGLSVQGPKDNAHVARVVVSVTDQNKPLFQIEYEDMNGNNIPTMNYRKNQSMEESYGDSL